jgi:hypothetical protein
MFTYNHIDMLYSNILGSVKQLVLMYRVCVTTTTLSSMVVVPISTAAV